MARELGDLIVRLSLDSTKFEDGMKRFESQMVKVQGKFKSSTSGITDFDKATSKLRTSADTLTDRLKLQKDKVAELESAYQKSVETKGADAAETQKLAAKLEDAKARLNQTEKALELVNEQIRLNENGWYRFGTNLDGIGTKLQDVGKKMSDVGTKLSLTLTAPIVALGTLAVKSGIEFESAFAGVKKTVEATEEEFKFLSDEIKRMSEVIPLSTTELSGIMEMAGQLGVRGTANLKKFTETIAALGVSTNLTNEDAASMLAQFSNITGMDISNIDKLGSVIVALGNNFATTESDIVRMGQRLAGAGAQLGLSEAQIMAFSAALSSVGIEAEAGGTAFSKLMINMKVASEVGSASNEIIKKTGLSLDQLRTLAGKGGKEFEKVAKRVGMTKKELKELIKSSGELEEFAKVSGMTADEFAMAFGEDATGAIMSFLQGLNTINENGGSAIVTLEEMGIKEVRLRDAILRACTATDMFSAAQELANEAWGENSALANEAGQRYATTESQIQMLKNAANNLAISFSEALMPTVQMVIDKLRGLVEWLQGLSAEQKETIVKVAAVVAALGPLLLVLGKVTTGVGTFMKFLAPLAKALAGAKAGTGAFGAVLTALSGPVGIVIAAVAALAAIFVVLYNTNAEFRAKMDALWAGIIAVIEPVKVLFQNTFAAMGQAMEPVMEALGRLWETVQGVFLKIWNFLAPILVAIGAALGVVAVVVASVVNGIMNAIGPLLEALVYAVDFAMNIFGALIAFLSGDFAGAWESLKAAFWSLWDTVVNVFQTIIGFFVGVWQGICAFASGFGIDLNAVFSGIWQAVSSGIMATWGAITVWLSGAWENVKEIASVAWSNTTACIGEAVATCKAGLESAWNATKAWLGETWEGIKATASEKWDGMMAGITSAVDTCKSTIQTAWAVAKTNLSATWDSIKSTASTTWDGIKAGISNAVNTCKASIETAWTNAKATITALWDGLKTTATSAWNAIGSNVQSATTNARAGIESAWSSIALAINAAWTAFKATATSSWNSVTGAVTSAVDTGKANIVSAWDNVKSGVSATWNKVLDVIKSPINTAQSWLQEKVNYFKGLFNFSWKLPDFKLPKVNVNWDDVGWGIKIPKMSLSWNALGGIFRSPTIFATANAGLQGVGEAGPEAILPLNTLWDELSVRLKAGMREILVDMTRGESARSDNLARAVAAALNVSRKDAPAMNVTQNIYADQTSYVGQQREAARNFRQIARALT